ncbi:MAG: LOG family protein [Rhodospirillaceae bacterium]|jgi:uncharacterized protein (TIGR00730 family)|nr:LOG family protein [Rhodospirillaceae bacterium]
MSEENGTGKAYRNDKFLNSSDARPLRIMSEFMEPQARFRDQNVSDVIVFFGSARMLSRDDAEANMAAARAGEGDIARAERDLKMSAYYEDARTLAARLTTWSKELEDTHRRFLVCTGGGPGIMEAANRGASEAGGINIGFNISLPHEQNENPYVTRELNFEFHYFFMRKFWFIYLAKALVVFPGGFGTLDELFESLTLIQTNKLSKRLPIVLYGKSFWRDVLDLKALVRHGTISAGDLDLFFETDSLDEAFDHIVNQLTTHSLGMPGGIL